MKLKSKLSLLAAGSVLVTASLAVLFAQVLGKRMIEDTWQTRFEDFAQALALPLSRAVSERDVVLLDAYVFDLVSRPSLYVHTIRIVDTSGTELVAVADEDGLLANFLVDTALPDPNLISLHTPLAWNGEPVGELRMLFSKTPVEHAVARMQQVILLIALLGSLIAILTSVRIADRLLQPLARLITQIGALRRNEPTELTPPPTGDEIGEMSNSFVDVYEELRGREQHNREMVNQLEHMTHQLSDELTLNAQLRERLEAENQVLQAQVDTQHAPLTVIGQDGDLRPVVEQAQRAAQSKLTVLLFGESGTGKEVVAQYIHHTSERREQSLITVNCAALPETLIESELFGHEKGAFTGATDKKVGKFVLADHGTIFLDEIGELPLAMQPKLLRVLETGQVDRIGSGTPATVDVRVIAATNRDLAQEVAAGRFREDLYYRLNVVHITLPPLRERPQDLASLADTFIEQTAQEMGIAPPVLSPAALSTLRAYNWPGNIRELRHVLAAALAQHPVVVLEPEHLSPLLSGVNLQGTAANGASPIKNKRTALLRDFDSLMAAQEKHLLEDLLDDCHSQKEMAERLKVSEARLHRLLKKHDLLGWKQHKQRRRASPE